MAISQEKHSDFFKCKLWQLSGLLFSGEVIPMLRSFRNTMRCYLSSLLYLLLGIVAHIPSHRIRKSILKMLGAEIANTVRLYHGFEVRSPWKLKIQDGSIIGNDSILDARAGLHIGKNVNLSSEVAIWTAQHDPQSAVFATTMKPVWIDDYAWLSFRCVILPGVTIGRGAVVAAGAIVTKDVPAFAIVAGIPARIIGERNVALCYDLAREQYTHFI